MSTTKGGNSSGPSDVAIDVVAGEDVQRVKITYGPDGAATRVDTGSPLPVVQTGTPALPTGASTLAEQQTQTTGIGATNETAPASDTASSGLNGRLQRIAQRLTTLIALLPTSLGAGGGLKVDGSGTALPVSQSGTWAATSRLTQARVSQTPTVSTSPAYASGDAVGGKLTFANAARVSGGSITIPSVHVTDKAKQSPVLELWLFVDDFTAATDNAAWDPSAADLANLFCAPIVVSDWKTGSTRAAAGRTAIGACGTLVGTSLYGQLVTRSTPTFTSTSDITVVVQTVQD